MLSKIKKSDYFHKQSLRDIFNYGKNIYIIAISIAHVMYTRALILCHEANSDGYSNISTNSEAIRVLYIALKSPYNTYAFAKGDSYNFRNVIKRTILKAMTKKDLFTSDVYGFVEELFSIISENEKRE